MFDTDSIIHLRVPAARKGAYYAAKDAGLIA